MTAATGVCHELGWSNTAQKFKVGCALYYSMAELGLQSQLQTPVAAVTVYSAME